MANFPSNFISLGKLETLYYPVGVVLDNTRIYTDKVAKAIYNTFKDQLSKGSTIVFVIRGTSGAILSGIVASSIQDLDPHINMRILIVRKPDETTHGYSLQGISNINKDKDIIIVIDDFIVTGNTIESIIEQLDNSKISLPKYHMLCVGNSIIDLAIEPRGEAWTHRKTISKILQRFTYIVTFD